jgi:hypothetical protein
LEGLSFPKPVFVEIRFFIYQPEHELPPFSLGRLAANEKDAQKEKLLQMKNTSLRPFFCNKTDVRVAG